MRVSDLADSQQIYDLQKELLEAEDTLARLVPQMGKALQIMKYDSDMCDRALAKAMTPFLGVEGESATSAKAKAQASFNYGEEMKGLSKAYANAAATRADWEYWKIRWKGRQSLISLERTLADL